MKAQKKLQRKRNSDYYRNPLQRFTKPQSGLYTIRASTSSQLQLLPAIVNMRPDVKKNLESNK